MKTRLLSGKTYNQGGQEEIAPERHIDSLRFAHYKFGRRTKPTDPRRILIVPVFGEFGCEVVASMYIIPRLLQKFPGYYAIVVGWYGREYLYRHLVDEFWELGEEHQWLREYCLAFHHNSVNLKRFEKAMKGKEGLLVSSNYMGRQILGSECPLCNGYWHEDGGYSTRCRVCGCENIRRALFSDMPECWSWACVPPKSSASKLEWARQRLPVNPVGVFARSRKCYSRNLPPEFYLMLIERLRARGYEPVWLGEPATTLPCPDPTVTDFSRMPEQRDLETTLAIISQLKFTMQFWTASTRLSAIAGTPYILFESPDQVWGNGQEGYRLELITRGGPRKVVANHFLNVLNDQQGGLAVAERAIAEVEAGDFSDSIGLVDEPDRTCKLMEAFQEKMRRGR